MMKKIFTIVGLLFCTGINCVGTNGVVEAVGFSTKVTAPVYKIADKMRQHDKLFQVGLQMLPESMLVSGALLFGDSAMGLSEGQGAALGSHITDTYLKIARDPVFKDVPSALPYCFSRTKNKEGHYYLYYPKNLSKKPDTIVFLHGYGGNFQFYTWVLKENFPDHVILVPSWGISWHRGSRTYVRDMVRDAQKRLDVKMKDPWLFAISAGGRGGFIIYNQMSKGFKGYVCIASAPETKVASGLKKDLNIMMINGTKDKLVSLKVAKKQAVLAKKKVPGLEFEQVEGDHFFLLSNTEETFTKIKAFMAD